MVDCFFMHEKVKQLMTQLDDGIPYKNLVILTEWKPNQDFTLKDGYYFETMTNLKVDENQI